MKKIVISKLALVAALALAAVLPYQASAIQITPSTAATATGNQNSQSQIDNAIAPFLGSSTELWKAEVGKPSSPATTYFGALQASYTATFANTPLDPEDALITYAGGNIVGPTAFLLVKDGNSTPAWYLFNLTALFNWDGMESIQLTDFWIGKGAISHVALYGSNIRPPDEEVPGIPDGGTTVMLLGAAIATLGMVRRMVKA